VLEQLDREPGAFPLVERQALMLFPFATREDGSCEQLGADGRCQVYATRPLICRIDMMAMARQLPWREAWTQAATACNALQEEAGLPAHYRVPLPTGDEGSERYGSEDARQDAARQNA